MAQRGGGGGLHGGMMGPHGFHNGHFHDDHFHDGHFQGHGFFPWWGFAPFTYSAYPYPYPAYPYPYYGTPTRRRVITNRRASRLARFLPPSLGATL
jgi:hypothetical protein